MSSFTTNLQVEPLDDGNRWKLLRSFQYHVGSRYSSNVIKVPAGFISDFTSVPEITSPIPGLVGIALQFIPNHTCNIIGVVILAILVALSWFRKWGRHGKATIIHDYLYQTKECSRAMADLIFKEAMEVLGCRPWRVNMMYYAVRTFGWIGYSKNNWIKKNVLGIRNGQDAETRSNKTLENSWNKDS